MRPVLLGPWLQKVLCGRDTERDQGYKGNLHTAVALDQSDLGGNLRCVWTCRRVEAAVVCKRARDSWVRVGVGVPSGPPGYARGVGRLTNTPSGSSAAVWLDAGLAQRGVGWVAGSRPALGNALETDSGRRHCRTTVLRGESAGPAVARGETNKSLTNICNK